MMTIHDMVRQAKAGYESVIRAIRKLSLNGRLVNGERVWTIDEARQIIDRASSK